MCIFHRLGGGHGKRSRAESGTKAVWNYGRAAKKSARIHWSKGDIIVEVTVMALEA